MKAFYIIIIALLACTAGAVVWKYASTDQGEFKGISRLSIPVYTPIPDAIGLSCRDAVARFGKPHIKISFHDTSIDHQTKLCNVMFHDVEKWDDCDAIQNGYAVIALHPKAQLFIEHAVFAEPGVMRFPFGMSLERGHYIVIQFRDGIVSDAENVHAQLVCFDMKP